MTMTWPWPASQQPASQQPASCQPTILNIGPCPSPKASRTVCVGFRVWRRVLWSLLYGALRLKWSRCGFRAGSTHKPKQSNTRFHAFAQSFCAKAAELRLKVCVCEKAPSKRELLYFVLLHFSYLLYRAIRVIL